VNIINLPSLSEVQNKLSNALQLLYKNDLFLIKNSVHERSITHKLAEYIQYIEDDKYSYQHGLLLCFHDELRDTQLDWFKNQDGSCFEVQ
jgi:disulfide oxidoreductase YuzD